MVKYKPKSYSVSEAGEDSGWLFNYEWFSLDDLRKYLIGYGYRTNEEYDVYAMYDVKRDKNRNVLSYKRYLIGRLKTGKDKNTWKSKKTGKTYKVNPKTGGI